MIDQVGGVPRQGIKILVPVGALGAGIKAAYVNDGLQSGIHAIAMDAGSTDSGPYYLGTGRPKYSRDAIKRDLRIAMLAQATAQVPLLIGSCGTSGCDAAVDDTVAIALEIAAEDGLTPKIAVLHSEQSYDSLYAKLNTAQISELAPSDSLTPEILQSCAHIVAMMGPEPYIEAVRAGADIVLGGRTTDSAVLAAVPLMYGAGAGPAWHAGKTAECGGQCTTNPTEGGVMVTVFGEHFEIEPLSKDNSCTPRTVYAHLLYENSDPLRLVEPGAIIDVSAATYEAISDRSVRVFGSQFIPQPYTMKLEGAGGSSFQTIMLVGIADPHVLADIDGFITRLHAAMVDLISRTMGDAVGDFDISLRAYGWNAVSGTGPAATIPPPPEIGLLFVATAATQEIATRIAKTCNPYFFHFPHAMNVELPSYAFPFSPAEIERGRLYEFKLNHVVEVSHPMELVRTSWIDLRTDAKEAVNAQT